MEIGRTQRIYPIEPLVGLRVWRAVDSHSFIHLASMFHGAEWPYSHPLVARCNHHSWDPLRPFDRNEHEAPAPRCKCGIYASSSGALRDYLPARLDVVRGLPIVVGHVALWGVVYGSRRGWRASLAYPQRLYVPVAGLDEHVARRVLTDLRLYGVPVESLGGRSAGGGLRGPQRRRGAARALGPGARSLIDAAVSAAARRSGRRGRAPVRRASR